MKNVNGVTKSVSRNPAKTSTQPANQNTESQATKTKRRGRHALEGMALYIPALRTILEEKDINPHYRKKLAERGYIGLTLKKEPGTMGRPRIAAYLTTKGQRYWDKHSDKVEGYLLAKNAA